MTNISDLNAEIIITIYYCLLAITVLAFSILSPDFPLLILDKSGINAEIPSPSESLMFCMYIIGALNRFSVEKLGNIRL